MPGDPRGWVSVSEIFPQEKGFQELPGRRGEPHVPRHGQSAQLAAMDFSLSPRGRGDGQAKSQREEGGHRPHTPCSKALPPAWTPRLGARRTAAEPRCSLGAPWALREAQTGAGLGAHSRSRGDGDSGPLLKPGTGRGCEGTGKQVRQPREETGWGWLPPAATLSSRHCSPVSFTRRNSLHRSLLRKKQLRARGTACRSSKLRTS